jgi:PPOX class probable F420-dependent enzyme
MTVTAMLNRTFEAILHPDAKGVGDAPPAGSLESLRRRKYCLVVTRRRDGRSVPTPVWFGVAGGKLYFRTEAEAGKVKRIRRDPYVRLAACNARGKPVGAPIAGSARVVPPAEIDVAEHAIAANYGTGRRLYQRFAATPTEVYVEVTPVVPAVPAST